jgi:hypothetical protein
MSRLQQLIIEEAQNRICQVAEQLLARSGLRFVLVCWVPGKAADARSITISAHPKARQETPTALTTAAHVAELTQTQGGHA